MPEPSTVVPTPPPAPAAPAAAAPPPEKPKIDPWVKHMAESIGMAVTDDITLTDAKPTDAPLPGDPLMEGQQERPRTLSDIGLEVIEREKAKAAEAPPAAPPAPAATGAEGAAPPATPPIELKPPSRAGVDELAARVTKDVLEEVKKLQAPPPAAETEPAAEDQWEATLPEENQEMLALLRWGEANGIDALKGKAAEQAAYFKKLEEYLKTEPDEDEQNDWIARNRVALPDRLLRKAAEERILSMAEERAAERIRKEQAPRLAELEAKQRTAEVRPLVNAAVSEFNNRFEQPGEKTRAGTPRIDSAVGKLLRTEGLEKAAELYPIEAPIVHQYEGLANEFLGLRAGLITQDMTKPAHQFLNNFIFRQEQAMLDLPEDKRRVNGQRFLPGSVYYSELAKDPTVAQRFSTFTDQNVLDMLEETVHRSVKKEYDRLEKAGFTRKPRAAASGVTPEPAKQEAAPAGSAEANGAPRGGTSKAPGAAAPNGNETNPNMQFLRAINPDADRVLAA